MTTATVLAPTIDMDREAWLEARKVGIGGSDAAMVMGVSKYGGPLTVYMDKMGDIPPSEESEPAYWGNVLEDIVAKEFAKRTGLKVRRQNKIFRHPEYPWMIANVDRAIAGGNQGLECKTASAFLSKEWEGDELPDAYYVQIQHYIAVMGWDSCWVAALIGGQRFNYKEVSRNDSYIDLLIKTEADFWNNNVEAGNPPPISWGDDAKKLFPHQESDGMVLPDDHMFLIAEELAEVNEEYKQVSKKKDELENVLKGRVGEQQGIIDICTWKEGKGTPKWKDIALELGADEPLINRHTSKTRRFNFKFKKEAS